MDREGLSGSQLTDRSLLPGPCRPLPAAQGNKGAFIRFDSDCTPSFTQFDAAPHPNKRPMAYAAGAWSSML